MTVSDYLDSICSLVDDIAPQLALLCQKVNDAASALSGFLEQNAIAPSEPNLSSVQLDELWQLCLDYAGAASKLYGHLITLQHSTIEVFDASEDRKSVETSNKTALDAFKILVRSSAASSSSRSTAAAPPVFLSHTGAQKPFAQHLAALLKLDKFSVAAFLDVNPETGVAHGEEIGVAVRRGLLGCKLGIVLLTPDFVGKKWPVFEWFMLEARAELCKNDDDNDKFRILHDVCERPDAAHWRDLGWPRHETHETKGTATAWLDVLQRLQLLRKLSARVAKQTNDAPEGFGDHRHKVVEIVRGLLSGKPSSGRPFLFF